MFNTKFIYYSLLFVLIVFINSCKAGVDLRARVVSEEITYHSDESSSIAFAIEVKEVFKKCKAEEARVAVTFSFWEHHFGEETRIFLFGDIKAGQKKTKSFTTKFARSVSIVSLPSGEEVEYVDSENKSVRSITFVEVESVKDAVCPFEAEVLGQL
ncbi:MAG: hypothetical protein HQM13_10035 [SAR324 cluster bacterium]|nr:hypothetical protein [SAR324 cluster bacterium]